MSALSSKKSKKGFTTPIKKSQTKSKKEEALPSCPVATAIGLLHGPRAETKSMGRDQYVSPTPLVIDMGVLAVMRSVFKPGKTYRFRCTRTASLTTSGSGGMLLATAISPTNMSEYSALTALFDECRLRSTRIQYAFLGNGTTPSSQVFCSSWDGANLSTPPASFTLACQLPGAKLTTVFQTSSSGLKNRALTPGRPWSLCTAGGSGIDPVGGVIGTWYHALAGNSSNTTIIANYLIECDYEFRNPL